MIEQVVNMKKRYHKLVEQFTQEDFKGYFAEFFTLYGCMTEVTWFHEDDQGTLLFSDPLILLTPSFLSQHPHFKDELDEDGWFDSYGVDTHDKLVYPELYDAVIDLRNLMEAKDVLIHVFGEDVDITATRDAVTAKKWREDATS